jgi:hypothetical protein
MVLGVGNTVNGHGWEGNLLTWQGKIHVLCGG